MQHPLEFGQGAAQRQCDPPLEVLGETRDPLGQDIGDDIRLLEVDVRGIDHQRHPPLHCVGELLFQIGELALGHLRGIRGQLLFFGKEVHVKVRGLHFPPREFRVLHLVAAKALAVGSRGHEHPTARDPSQAAHGNPLYHAPLSACGAQTTG